ncbi:MAG: molecular chaperone TorD family protein, partial [Candidatus Omnitrophica bacterium]|nr:molecular chaperone TorD family protein [Candidatus Omnitrophota bacterium]
ARAVEKTYRDEAGFELDPKFHDLPDHVACELEFAGRLYRKEKVDAAVHFIKNHLAQWIFHFLSNLKKQKRSIFYQKVAMSLTNFLERECCFEAVSHISE